MWRLVSREVRVFLFLLLAFALCTSILFRLYLHFRLLQFERVYEEVSETGNGLEQLSYLALETQGGGESLAELEFSAYYAEDLALLEQETAELESRQSGLSLRERKKRAADLWNNELQRMASDIAAFLPDEDARQDFHTDQRNFLSARRHSLMKELESGTGSTGSIAYLTSYASLTRERCYALLEKYK